MGNLLFLGVLLYMTSKVVRKLLFEKEIKLTIKESASQEEYFKQLSDLFEANFYKATLQDNELTVNKVKRFDILFSLACLYLLIVPFIVYLVHYFFGRLDTRTYLFDGEKIVLH